MSDASPAPVRNPSLRDLAAAGESVSARVVVREIRKAIELMRVNADHYRGVDGEQARAYRMAMSFLEHLVADPLPDDQ